MLTEIVAVVLAGAVIAAYFERKGLRGDALKAMVSAEDAAQKFMLALRMRESQIRSKISVEVGKVVLSAKADVAKAVAEVHAEEEAAADLGAVGKAYIHAAVTKVDDRLKVVVAKLEADIRKVI